MPHIKSCPTLYYLQFKWILIQFHIVAYQFIVKKRSDENWNGYSVLWCCGPRWVSSVYVIRGSGSCFMWNVYSVIMISAGRDVCHRFRCNVNWFGGWLDFDGARNQFWLRPVFATRPSLSPRFSRLRC